MKWQAIASLTSQINEEAKSCLERKLQKDASVQAAKVWADFIVETNQHLHQAQGNLSVASNDKTGGLSCLTSFDELHEDFLENNQPFLQYALGKYDSRASGYLVAVKNPYAKRRLEEKISLYRMHLAEQISNTEARLIDGKRHSMAIAAIEKLKHAAYDSPELYSAHLQDSELAINALSLLPQEKDEMLLNARSELAQAAALGTMRVSPGVILDERIEADWKEHLPLAQRVRLQEQAASLLRHQQTMRQSQVRKLAKSHFASLLKTGRGISGFASLLHSSYAQDDPQLQEIKEQEALHQEAFLTWQQLKAASFQEGAQILQKLKPKAGDSDYAAKERVHSILAKQFAEQIELASSDPARLAEELFSEEMPEAMELLPRLLLRKQLQQQKGLPPYSQRYLMNDERDDYLARLRSSDPVEIKKQLDSISAIGEGSGGFSLGSELIEEIMQAETGASGRRLSALTHLYVSAYIDKNNALMHDSAQAIAMQGQLFGEFAKADERAIKNSIKESGMVQDFEYRMLQGTPDNAQLLEQIKESILNLARFYQHQHHLEPAKASKRAIEELIGKRYIKPINDLYLPANILEDGRLVKLNSEHLNYNLNKLRADLIYDRLPPLEAYDKTHSFGRQYEDDRQKLLDKRMKELLREGQFKLTPDQKHIYFVYYDDQGAHNLLTSDAALWHVPLSQLNNLPSNDGIMQFEKLEFRH